MDRREMMRILAGGAAIAVTGCGPAYYQAPPPRPAWYYDYYYYPHVGVYFHIYSGYYYYPVDGRWHRARTLPSRIYLDPRVRVRLDIKADRPYVRYDRHRRAYPPPRQYRPDPRRNREERQHNLRQHEQYRRRRPN